MSADPEQITFFAKTDARGAQVPFGIKAKDRTRHVYVIGKTGMGKSTLLENMAVQDMQHGNGMCFIDPHGATAETLLNYVPEHRKDDVLYFAPFDTENPIAFNVMEDVGPERRHLVAAGLMSVFKKIWVDAWSARMEYILQNTILALLEYPDSTLLGINRMLSEKHYRKKVIDNITDPAIKSFWVDEFLNYNERYMQEAGDAIKNKIGQFTANPLIRNIIGQPHTSFDLREIMDQKKIVIVNLSKGLIGEGNANLLGSMLTTRIYLAAMSRADLSPMEMKQMPNFYFYVDEFQSFANATFADILSEARKYHLNLTIAHQYVEQMEEEVRNAVFGNVGTIISFRVGPFDAETLETIFAPQFYAVDICNLGFAQIYLSLMIDGIGSRPFSAVTLPPIEIPEVSYRNMVICRSQENFGRPRAEIEKKINDWMSEDHTPPKPPRQNGGGNNKPHAHNHSQTNGKSNNGRNTGPSRSRNEDYSAKKTGGNNEHSERPAKPPVADLAALRSVLKDLAGEQNTNSNENATNNGISGRSKSPIATRDTVKKTDRQSENKQRSSETNTDTKHDLQAVLQNLTQLKEPASESSSVVADTPNRNNKKSAVSSDADTEKRSRNDVSAQVGEMQKKLNAVIQKKTVASKESESASKPVVKKTTNTSTSLRDALTQALSTTSPDPKVQSNPVLVQEKNEPPKSDPEAVIKSDTRIKNNHTYEQVKSVDTNNTLDPKKLERMMRVTTADHSPFKK